MNENGTQCITQVEMAEIIKISKRAIQNNIKELVEEDILQIKLKPVKDLPINTFLIFYMVGKCILILHLPLFTECVGEYKGNISRMIDMRNKEIYDYYASNDIPFGANRVITTYLFANTNWRKNIHRCDLHSEEVAIFLTDFVEKSGCVKAMFYALAKLLNTVGMETYRVSGYIS